jgi:hypothetical protein
MTLKRNVWRGEARRKGYSEYKATPEIKNF